MADTAEDGVTAFNTAFAQDGVLFYVPKNVVVEKPDYQVDGISGGTITSVGVDAMLKACLSSYKNFLTNNNEEE